MDLFENITNNIRKNEIDKLQHIINLFHDNERKKLIGEFNNTVNISINIIKLF